MGVSYPATATLADRSEPAPVADNAAVAPAIAAAGDALLAGVQPRPPTRRSVGSRPRSP